jgi:Ca-activated chloride channel family protein
MAEKVAAENSHGSVAMMPKIDILKDLATAFVNDTEAQGNHLFGIVTLARNAEVLVPPTLDRDVVLQMINSLYAHQKQEDAGTVLGYAIFKAANLIATMRHYVDQVDKESAPYVLHDTVLILITDGFQDPNRLDKDKELRNIPPMRAAEYAKSEKVRLYIINIDPSLASEQYSAERHQMQKAAELTGGKFFLLEPRGSIEAIFREVDAMEASRWQIAMPKRSAEEKDSVAMPKKPLFPLFIAIGFLFFSISILLETRFLRSWP